MCRGPLSKPPINAPFDAVPFIAKMPDAAPMLDITLLIDGQLDVVPFIAKVPDAEPFVDARRR